MSVTKRSIHIALYHLKYRVRKKNKHRVTRLIKSGFNRRTFDIEELKSNLIEYFDLEVEE